MRFGPCLTLIKLIGKFYIIGRFEGLVTETRVLLAWSKTSLGFQALPRLRALRARFNLREREMYVNGEGLEPRLE